MNLLQKLSVKKLHGIHVTRGSHDNQNLAVSLSIDLMQLGYMCSLNLINSIATLSESDIVTLQIELIDTVRRIVGADVQYSPMYPNFPAQVADADYIELFFNATIHYGTGGKWLPSYATDPRTPVLEDVNFKILQPLSNSDIVGYYTKLMNSSDSLSQEDISYLKWYVMHSELNLPEVECAYKETMCVVAGMLLLKGQPIDGIVTNATDILRIATSLSGGDVSLADNTKFKSMPRSVRRILTNALENVINEEDINRHRNKWVKLFHSLHVGDYSDKVFTIAKLVRENQKIETFNAKVSAAFNRGDYKSMVYSLTKRPSEFARRFDLMLRSFPTHKSFISEAFFADTNINKIPSRILLQLWGHLKTRLRDPAERVVFPKGNAQKAVIIPPIHEKLAADSTVTKYIKHIQNELMVRFSELDDLGPVWIDPNLAKCPIPTGQRSASEGIYSVTRGTQIPMDDKGTIRLFIYWKGIDIDLSATFHDEDFNQLSHVSYTNLRDSDAKSYYSGDITNARHGASEFIDIDIESALNNGNRYIVMNVYVYTGGNFADHDVCYAGWMTRDHVNSNEIYDAKTVIQKCDMTQNSRNAIPVVFDLKERKVIWTDLISNGRSSNGGNNVESNRATTMQTLKAITAVTQGKVSLYELFALHAKARNGKLVECAEEAKHVFSFDPSPDTVTPFDTTVISSDYVV